MWYSKYLQVYKKPFDKAPQSIIERVTDKLKSIQCSNPLVTVCLIAYNEEEHLLACIWSLCENLCDYPFEIIAINNASTDNTEEILKQLGVTYFNETKKSPGHARQCGLDHARGLYYLSIDSDTIYPKHYIQTMTRNLQKKGVVIVTGLWNFLPSERNGQIALFFYESIRNIFLKLQSIKRPELIVRGAISGYRIKEARKYGYRTDIRRGEDGSLALAMKQDGNIKFLTGKKTCVITDDAALAMEGSIFKSMLNRAKKIILNIGGLLRKKTVYQDDESNIIK